MEYVIILSFLFGLAFGYISCLTFRYQDKIDKNNAEIESLINELKNTKQ